METPLGPLQACCSGRPTLGSESCVLYVCCMLHLWAFLSYEQGFPSSSTGGAQGTTHSQTSKHDLRKFHVRERASLREARAKSKFNISAVVEGTDNSSGKRGYLGTGSTGGPRHQASARAMSWYFKMLFGKTITFRIISHNDRVDFCYVLQIFLVFDELSGKKSTPLQLRKGYVRFT